MIRQSRDIIYIEDSGPLCSFLPDERRLSKSHDHKKWLLAMTKKRLKKMGFETELRRVDVFTITGHRIDSERLSSIIVEMDYHTGRLFMEPHCLLMGHRQLESLIGEAITAESGYGQFHAAIDIRYGQQKIYGIDIKVVPGLDTLVMIPKSIL